jgi:hypothetical protein
MMFHWAVGWPDILPNLSNSRGKLGFFLNLNFIAGDFLHIKFNQLADGGKLIKKE